MITRKSKGEYKHLELFDSRDWGLVIYDEVHLLPAPVFRMTADLQSRRRLGLTATLVREDGREGDVFSLIGPKRYDAPWKDIEAQGWIAPADCVEVRVTLTDAERMAYATAEPEERYKLCSTARTKHAVVKSILDRHPGAPTLVIGAYLDQLEELGAELDAPVIQGSTRNKEREALFDRFRAGEIQTLVVSKVANFSIDLPEASVAVQVSGTFGSRQEEAQRWADSCVPSTTAVRHTSTRWSLGTRSTPSTPPTVNASSPSRATRTGSRTPTTCSARPSDRTLTRATLRVPGRQTSCQGRQRDPRRSATVAVVGRADGGPARRRRGVDVRPGTPVVVHPRRGSRDLRTDLALHGGVDASEGGQHRGPLREG